MNSVETIIECGCCGAFHLASFFGDCRDDNNRIYPDEYARKVGVEEYDLNIIYLDHTE